jgi:phosphoglycolate phosphatase-like HAD superfamily hydrolase
MFASTRPQRITPSTLLRLAITMVLVLAVAGCSSAKLAYRYADLGTVWWVEDYVSLNSDQEKALKQGIRDFRQWHCSRELPRYELWLSTVIADANSAGLTDSARMTFHQEQLLALLPALTEKATPMVVAFLKTLSDEQVQELAANMADRQQELELDLLKGTPEATASARAERTAERLESWLGNFDDDQYFRIQRWSAAQAGQTDIWLEGREQWQQTFLEALQQRQAPKFDSVIADLLQNPEQARGLVYQQTMTQSKTAMTKLLSDLLTMGGEPALENVKAKATELKSDVDVLTCSLPSI